MIEKAAALTLQERNRRLAWWLGGVALLMTGFGYLLAANYDRLCQALGLDRASSSLSGSGQPLRVEFDSSVAPGLNVRFSTATPVVITRAGELLKGHFVLENFGSEAVDVVAIPSYAPVRAAGVLQKTECFCFNGMRLAAGERKEVTVALLVSRELPEELGVATLAYQLRPATGVTP
ncbi:cytochrome c oxidase assembly protein [Chitinilyticum litopenaei]|uniref:cytochrome c oxidase assembly protein n=1 Tax=Chitinilyticum litopenaei TaxID=1121276 RepID=UPI000423AF6C|nr:cytochrome c oxidase assembly protein [Chitinilyticum litopenaei]